MTDKDFQNLLQGVREAGAYMRGDRSMAVRVDCWEPDDVAVVRARLGLSQARFAKVLGISVDTLQNWEQKRRKPTGPARVLIRMASKHPEALLEAVS